MIELTIIVLIIGVVIDRRLYRIHQAQREILEALRRR